MLSEGILAVMENTKKAKALTTNSEVHEILSRDMEAYRELSNKICGMMVELGECRWKADAILTAL